MCSAVITLPANITQIPGSIGAALSQQPELVQLFYIEGMEVKALVKSAGEWMVKALSSDLPKSNILSGPMAAVGWNQSATRLYYVVDNDIIEMAYETSYGWERGSMPPIPY